MRSVLALFSGVLRRFIYWAPFWLLDVFDFWEKYIYPKLPEVWQAGTNEIGNVTPILVTCGIVVAVVATFTEWHTRARIAAGTLADIDSAKPRITVLDVYSECRPYEPTEDENLEIYEGDRDVFLGYVEFQNEPLAPTDRSDVAHLQARLNYSLPDGSSAFSIIEPAFLPGYWSDLTSLDIPIGDRPFPNIVPGPVSMKPGEQKQLYLTIRRRLSPNCHGFGPESETQEDRLSHFYRLEGLGPLFVEVMLIGHWVKESFKFRITHPVLGEGRTYSRPYVEYIREVPRRFRKPKVEVLAHSQSPPGDEDAEAGGLREGWFKWMFWH